MENLENLLKNSDNLTKKLVNAKKELSAQKGEDMEVIDNKLVNELKQLQEIKTNAPSNSTTSGASSEIYPGTITLSNVLMDDNLSPDYEFLRAFSAPRTDLDKGANNSLPIITEPGLVRGITERSTGTVNVGAGFNNLNTTKVDILTKQLGNAVDITSYLLKYGVVNALEVTRQQDAMSYAYSIANAVINGDITATATGNINSDDQLPATTFPASADGFPHIFNYYANSARYSAITAGAGVGTIDIGAVAGVDDIFDVAKLLKSRGRANPRNRFILMNNETYFEYMKQDDFKDASINGQSSTITTGAITNIGGMDLFISDVLALTEADGKLSGATPANNVKGGFMILTRDAIQHGRNNRIETDVVSNLLKGVQYQSTARFGFGNIDGVNGRRIAMGINVTV